MFLSYIEGVFSRLLAKTTETHKFFGQITSDFGAFYLCARQKLTRYTQCEICFCCCCCCFRFGYYNATSRRRRWLCVCDEKNVVQHVLVEQSTSQPSIQWLLKLRFVARQVHYIYAWTFAWFIRHFCHTPQKTLKYFMGAVRGPITRF